MDRNQILNDPETAQRYALQSLQAQMWTSFPAIVQSVNLAQMTLSCVPVTKGVETNSDGTQSYVNMPALLDVPICFPSAGGFLITLPIKAGDEILAVIASRCIDAWWQNGGFQNPMELRMHDLSDGFAIPGPRSLPNVVSGISADGLQVRNDAGTVIFGLTAAGKFQFLNVATSLKSVLTDFQTAVNNFMTVLTTFSGGASAVSQDMLKVPATTAVTALTTVLTEIGELLQ